MSLRSIQPENGIHGFKDFLSNLKNEYLDNTSQHEKEINNYLKDVKLWPNQFVYIHQIKTNQFYHKGFDVALGYSMNHLMADFLVNSIHPADLSMYFKLSKALLRFVMDNSADLVPFESSFNVSYRVKKKDGTYISVLRQSTPFIKNKYNRVEAYISLCTNVSDVMDNHRVNWNIYGPKCETFDYYLKQQSHPDDQKEFFSDRELEVLRLLAHSFSSGEISNKLCISVNTVNTHRKKMMKKANVNKTIDLILFAKENGWV